MSQKFKHPYGKLAKKYRRFRKNLPDVVSNIALNEFVDNFKKQGYENENGVHIPWKPTKKKARRTLGRRSKGILIGRGRLVRSMKTAPTFLKARVVSNLPYAQPHNEGFEGTVRVRSHTRNSYSKKEEEYTTRRGNRRKKVVNKKRGQTRVMAHTRKMKIERRPFMITSKTIKDKTEKHTFRELEKMWKQL